MDGWTMLISQDPVAELGVQKVMLQFKYLTRWIFNYTSQPCLPFLLGLGKLLQVESWWM